MAFTRLKTGGHEMVEEVIAEFVTELRGVGTPVTIETIQAKAREVANAKGVSDPVLKPAGAGQHSP